MIYPVLRVSILPRFIYLLLTKYRNQKYTPRTYFST